LAVSERYYRCTNDACRRKWHRATIAYIAMPRHVVRKDLLDMPAPQPMAVLGETQWLCPSCQGDLVPEAGTFEELFLASKVVA
jgi:hypothetical protein